MTPRKIVKKFGSIWPRTRDIALSVVLIFLVLILGGVTAGCSTTERRKARESSPDLYLHLYASFIYPKPPRLILSVPVPVSSDFDIPMDGHQRLRGRIDPCNKDYFVHFQGRTSSGTYVFSGEVALEKQYEPGRQPYVNAPFICQPHFVLSTKPDSKSFLGRQAAAEKEAWLLRHPLSTRQLAKVKKQFQLMRPGMTEDQVFMLLGLSRYRNQLEPSWPSYKWGLSDYLLADGVRLLLFLDNTGVGTKTLKFADGQELEWLDYASDRSRRTVIRAELDTATWDDGGRIWQTSLQWP